MSPATASRRRLIRQLVAELRVSSQRQLVSLLAESGHSVTQATVSRDLDALGAEKVRIEGGSRYQIPDDDRFGASERDRALARALTEHVESIEASGNLVVLHTPPGAAQVVASSIDGAGLPGVIGTVAGDDTLLVVTGEPGGAKALAGSLERIGAG